MAAVKIKNYYEYTPSEDNNNEGSWKYYDGDDYEFRDGGAYYVDAGFLYQTATVDLITGAPMKSSNYDEFIIAYSGNLILGTGNVYYPTVFENTYVNNYGEMITFDSDDTVCFYSSGSSDYDKEYYSYIKEYDRIYVYGYSRLKMTLVEYDGALYAEAYEKMY